MLFNSFEFMLFLPIVFLLYWFVFKPRRLQNLFLVVASYVFYGWWDWRFLLLIALTSACSYASGLLLEHYEGRRKAQKIVSASNIVLNLLILGIFKYYNFFVESLETLFASLFNYHLDWVTINVILPVGISFYTFQALSYTIDVYQKKLPATHDIVEFFAYISFFPQLVAGPIERATNLLPQFQKSREFDYAKAVDGCRQMLWGFFKKLVVADNCAMQINGIWESDYSQQPGIGLIMIGILFSFQIYCDFSGYSDIAIGCGKLFGFNLMRNFNYPYFSRSIPEFWRRWHISLMTWFRDYIYFPLGGSRCERWKILRNIIIVFFVSGLWHGANWTFVCWGLYHATLISIYVILGANTKPQKEQNKLFPPITDLIQMTTTFTLVVIGWILFRCTDMGQFSNFIKAIVINPIWGNTPTSHTFAYTILGFILLGIEWLQRDKQHPLEFPCNHLFNNKIIRWSIYVFLFVFIVSSMGENQTFLYFQF